jgi:hypothetical protein
MRKSFLPAALFFLLGIQGQAVGESIRFDFQGIVTETTGIESYPSWDIDIGDTFEGSWVLDTTSPLIISNTYLDEGSMNIELGSDSIQSTDPNPVSISNNQIIVDTTIPDATSILSTSYDYFADDGILILDVSGPPIYTLSDVAANLDSLVFDGTFGLWGFRSGTNYHDTIQFMADIEYITATIQDAPSDGPSDAPSEEIFFPVKNPKTGKIVMIYIAP